MTDMVENGFSAGAGALPPDGPHHEFLDLCALATSGSLNATERKRLEDHLSHCASCRAAMAQYQAVVAKAIPAVAPEFPPENEGDASWSLDQAEASLFARLNKEPEQPESAEASLLNSPYDPDPAPLISRADTIWRHMWWQFAAGLLLVVALGFSVYRIGLHRGTELEKRAAPAASARQFTLAPTAGGVASSAVPAIGEAQRKDGEVAQLRAQLKEQSSEISRLKASQAAIEVDRREKQADANRITEERTDLATKLGIAQSGLLATQQKLDAATSEAARGAAQAAGLESRVKELTDEVHERDQDVAQQRELLDHDRDIRDLMGARDLYIAEVYDVAKTGDTQKPFGRVFYTKGKSLIFYAYDLDQQAGLKTANTFQAWGRRGPDRDEAVSLGILYQDNASKKRWVVKSENPKTLAQIDAVFVTVEPHGGSSHPSGKPLLFAYLRIGANHP